MQKNRISAWCLLFLPLCTLVPPTPALHSPWCMSELSSAPLPLDPIPFRALAKRYFSKVQVVLACSDWQYLVERTCWLSLLGRVGPVPILPSRRRSFALSGTLYLSRLQAHDEPIVRKAKDSLRRLLFAHFVPSVASLICNCLW